ncbi:MAG: LL-diaminopimelate aminotransferase [Oscillospiraceae bacterium]|nr:LL-diaminopimelate aminotransferase [Oscillospiraceae bacterium]
MANLNQNFLNLKESYLFIEISKRIKEFMNNNPDVSLIRMGIGDVTQPLAPAVVEAGYKAFAEMGVKATFRGYEDSGRGYEFLREAVAGYYKSFGVQVPVDEVYIGDGAKSDCGNIGDIFSADNIVLVTDPVYPVYVDANVMSGKKVLFTDFVGSSLPEKVDIIHLCSPNNPTGAAYTYEQLKKWVDYALSNKAVIIYDAAYEAFITEPDKPRSIFSVEGARSCAIEICSFSKTAGFTGTRCGYTIIPKDLMLYTTDNTEMPLYKLWERRQGSKFNGVSYPVQRAAEAVFTPQGIQQTQETISYYRGNAAIMMKTLSELKITFTGGINSPYVWFKCPNNMDSWEFFDYMLKEINVVGTPGAGFGENGAGWFRLTAFNTKENTIEAMERLTKLLS